jgi:hypothetical protein
MDIDHLLLVCLAIGAVAFLYSSVGHAGASGYIAVLTLVGFAASTIKPTAFILNIFVACIGTFQFWKAGHFSLRLFWPFALLSVPAAFLGGYLNLSPGICKPLVGIVLMCGAAGLALRYRDPAHVAPPAAPLAVSLGACIGLSSGLTGTGGGIFLTPLLLFCRWAHTRPAAAVSALFILLNSVAGPVGYISSGQPIPSFAWALVVAAVGGGFAGSYLGSKKFHTRIIQPLLAAVLVIAGSKLIFVA